MKNHQEKKYRRHIITTMLCLLFVFPVYGQKYYFDKYGVKHGLGSSKVYGVIQDSRDIIWLGTETGLSRFNGMEFVNYSPKDGMANSGVNSLFEDMDGNLWFGHLNGGLTYYDGKNFKAINIPIEDIGDITSINQLRKDTLWITTFSAGTLRLLFDKKSMQLELIKQYTGKEKLSDQIIGSYVDKSGNYFCLTVDGGIGKYSPGTDLFEKFHPGGLTRYFPTICMLQDSENNYWFGTYNGGLYKYLTEKDTILFFDYIRDGHAGNWITTLCEDKYGNVWAGTYGKGLSRFSKEGIMVFNATNGLSAKTIQDLTTDSEGNVIISSRENGIHIFKGDQFVTINEDEIFEDKNVNCIQKDNNGNYWLGTNKGIVVYQPGMKKPAMVINYERNAIYENISFIKKDYSGLLWILAEEVNSNRFGIFTFDTETNRLREEFDLNNELSKASQNIDKVTVIEAHGSNLWIGTDNGLKKWDIKKRELIGYSQSQGLFGNHINTLFFDHNDALWVATTSKSGVSRLLPNTDKFEKININKSLEINSIYVDKENIAWLGTTQGLYIVDNEIILKSLTEENGLASNNVNLITPDKNGILYLGTNNGMNTYHPETGQIYTYTEKSGFIGIETKPNSFYNDENGQICMGTLDGVTVVYPDRFDFTLNEPIVHFHKITMEGELVTDHKVHKFNHRKNDLVVEYYTISLKNPDEVVYQVMLEGSDEDWRPVTHQTMETYTGQKPGKYTFKVRARNSDGIWSKEAKTFRFVIRPPFYATYWFLISSIIAIVIGIIAFIKIRTRNLLRDKRKLEHTVAERTAEVVKKSVELEHKNKDIMASIRYAERIQKALLPSEKLDCETFVMYRPKEHVSGDFYWMHNDGNRNFIAAVDCTGHGVPGAFMSIIGHDSFNKIVKEYHETQPDIILNRLNEEVYNSLAKDSQEEIQDGMDLALVVYHPQQNKIEYAGAYNPLIKIKNGELEEIKANRFSIGRTSVLSGFTFTRHELEVEKGDTFYIFSDGYADQFGGDKNTKFKKVNLKKELIALQDMDM
ncbi:MAG: SpoIIE family protein phosphatase, partial [Bacteroidales bacterium]|nr:SpoIIE family protein phosphatase [Bacteroidales bacterium]